MFSQFCSKNINIALVDVHVKFTVVDMIVICMAHVLYHDMSEMFIQHIFVVIVALVGK